ncbi:MAG TPA: ABC transporter permease [Candidatus Methylomirabilis sp.]|jgi:ABC-type tungstate transport system substrate-binding protein|nr:ABC transporter permease [Candidatus Methylomirabilis sp.]
MGLIWDGLQEALQLVLTGDPEVWEITLLSLRVSGTALLIALLLGLPAAALLAFGRFPGRALFVSAVNAGMGLPPVVVGLLVTILLWRSGPLGFLEILYTPSAMILAQTIIALPIVTGLAMAALQALNPRLRLQLLALGASPVQAAALLLYEARGALLAAVMAAGGRLLAEVGAVLMVGGNIRHLTRVLTTATVLETSMGKFETAIALGLILLTLAFALNAALTAVQQRGRRP